MDKTEVVVDTNVPITANFKAGQADSECEAACIRALRQVQTERRTLLDDKWLIIEEYRKHLSHSGQPGLGDAFFKWLWENQANPRSLQNTYPITRPRLTAEFADLPERSASRARSTWSDRKFVAVALASGTGPELLNATDTDWWHDRQALVENGINVVFLCPELMKRER